MTKKTLYQLGGSNQVKVWTIEVIDNGTSSTILSTAGAQGGKMREDKIDVTVGKGKETHYSQAVKDAQSKFNGKIKKGYVEDITKIQSSAVLGTAKLPAPMLAHKYDPTKKQSSSKDLKGWGLEGKRIAVQRKKDGCRCNIHVTATTAKANFRSGLPVPTEGIEHILEAALKSFQKIYKYVNTKYGITEYTLDGELFIPASIYPFSKAAGLFKKEEKDASEIAVLKQAKLHLYDVMLDANYETRYKIIQNWKSPSIHVEEAIFIIASEKEIDKYLQIFLAEGEEGLMIRTLDCPYEYKRSTSLLKCKIFEDKEFVCVGFEEDARGGFAGKVICKMDVVAHGSDGKLIENIRPGLNFTQAEAKDMWLNQSKYIGKKVTVTFFGRSEYKVPRFPKAKAFRGKND